MPTSFYDAGANGLWVFLLLTVILGGGGAFVSGKSIAETWRPFWQLPLYMAILALMVRFMHFALFDEVLLSMRNLLVDFAILLTCAIVGFKLKRGRQMTSQYGAIGH